MKNVVVFSGSILLTVYLSTSCEMSAKRLDFCECNDIEKIMTEEYTMSENEKQEKQEACAWINEEMSQIEQLNAMKKCLDDKVKN